MRWTEEQYEAFRQGQGKKTHPAPVKKRDGINKTEAAYGEHLEMLKKAGEIVDYRFEPLKLRLADKTYYNPDYLVIYPGHFEIHEVKGFWRDDARVKIKVAAEMFPWFLFRAIQRDGKGWRYEEF